MDSGPERAHADWLIGELPALQRDGVIDPPTAERLHRRYAQGAASLNASSNADPAMRAGRPLSRAVVISALLGAGLLGLGLLQIVAHNWDEWGKAGRLAIAFGPLLALQALALWVLVRRPGNTAWGEAVATALALAAAATLALVGQIYHFPGDPQRYLLAVSLLALPLAYVFDSAAVAALALSALTGWHLFDYAWHPGSPWRYALVVAPLAPFAWRMLQAGDSWRARMFMAVLAGSVSICVVTAGFRDGHGLWLRLALLASVLVLAGFGGAGSGRAPLLRYGESGIALMALAGTWPELWQHGSGRWFSGEVAGAWLLIEGGAWIALLVWRGRQGWLRDWDALLMAGWPVVVMLGTQLAGDRLALGLLANGYALAFGIALLRRGLREESFTIVNRGLAIVALLILMRFFDSQLPFLLRGLAFMAVGAGFLGANLWLRRRLA